MHAFGFDDMILSRYTLWVISIFIKNDRSLKVNKPYKIVT
jgi:hypothetical protein